MENDFWNYGPNKILERKKERKKEGKKERKKKKTRKKEMKKKIMGVDKTTMAGNAIYKCDAMYK